MPPYRGAGAPATAGTGMMGQGGGSAGPGTNPPIPVTLAVTFLDSGGQYPGTSYTKSLTVPAGAEWLIVLAAGTGNPTSCKWNGVDLTKVVDPGNAGYTTTVWALKNPAAGTFNLVTAGMTDRIGIAAYYATGAHASVIVNATYGNQHAAASATSASAATNSSPGDICLAVRSCQSLSMTLSGGAVKDAETVWGGDTGEDIVAAHLAASGGATTTMAGTWTGGSGMDWTVVAVQHG